MKTMISPNDILPYDEFASIRKEKRKEVMEIKRHRRVFLGEYITFIFENYDTWLWQIQEMLHIEKGGVEQLKDELEAYAPLLPNGKELVATVMIEINDPVERLFILKSLIGIESHFFIQIGHEKIQGLTDQDPSTDKALSVYFFKFSFTDEQTASFKDALQPASIVCTHPRYHFQTQLTDDQRNALIKDFI